MMKKLYDWVLSLSARKSAEIWLAVIAVIESSFFLIPADVLFLPMALARPQKAYRLALIATVASVVGGILGYFIGMFLFEALAKPVLATFGELQKFEQLKSCSGNQTLVVLLLTSGLAHIPPIKIVTILAGVVQINFAFFVAACIVARGARFFALAWALRRWGEAIKHFIENRLGLIAGLIAAIVIMLYVIISLLGHTGTLGC
ncbi:MAG TPA: YqaA family protein [Aestuariivirga sp.]